MYGAFGSVATAGSQSSVFRFMSCSPVHPGVAKGDESCVAAAPKVPADRASWSAFRRAVVVSSFSPPAARCWLESIPSAPVEVCEARPTPEQAIIRTIGTTSRFFRRRAMDRYLLRGGLRRYCAQRSRTSHDGGQESGQSELLEAR